MAPELVVTLIEQEVGERERRDGGRKEREDGEGEGDQGFESTHIISYLSVYYVFFLSSSMLKGLFH